MLPLLAFPASLLAASLPLPPPMPASWPSIDQLQPISASQLADPLVTSALAYVNSVVPAQTLAIPPSTFVSGSTVTYNADPVANCYWAFNLCTRATDTAAYKADVTVCPNQNDWGVTFDDGPRVNATGGNDTPALRNALAAANVKATFFIVGSNAIQFPQEILSSYQAGHQIAVHTWNHHPLTSQSNAQIVAEIKYTEAIIYKTIGVVPRYFRPPYGDIDDRVRAIIGALGYKIVIWTTTPSRDSTDADQLTLSATTSASVLKIVQGWFTPQPGFISLEHDISSFTTSIGIKVMGSIKGMTGFPLNPKTVANCLGDMQPYMSSSGLTAGPNATGSVNGPSTASRNSDVQLFTEKFSLLAFVLALLL